MIYCEQQKDYTCGCACVRMAISHFEDEVPTELYLEEVLKTLSNKGTHPNQIKQYFLDKGYDVVEENNSSIERVRHFYEKDYVVMLAVSVDVPHFTIYNGDNGNHIFLFDPYFGEISKLLSKFLSPKNIYPFYRWRVIAEEFKKYYPEANFDDEESYNYFLAVRKFLP
jgi:predicted double-glycine peptidase